MLKKNTSFSGPVEEVEKKYRYGIQQIPLYMEKIEIPTIAAINGPAVGAGFDLACMCDFRIMSNNAFLAESFIDLGIIPGDGGAFFLQRLIGYQKAAELTLTGRKVSASEALEIGITIAGGAETILLDEPTAGMSKSETERAVNLIHKISNDRTLLIVEHDMGVVFDLSDTISVLVYGQIICSDKPENVKNNSEVRKAYLGNYGD